MSTPIDDGGPAFPGESGETGYGNSKRVFGPHGNAYFVDLNQGMSLLDYFAGQALNGWISRIAANQEAEDLFKKAGIEGAMIEPSVANLCYSMASAMIAARNGKEWS